MKNDGLKIITVNPNDSIGSPVILDINMNPIITPPIESTISEDKPLNAKPVEGHLRLEEKRELSDGTMGYVMPHEVEEATKFIEEQLGFELPVIPAYFMLVKIYERKALTTFVNEKGENVTIELPDEYAGLDRYKQCSALVLAQGPACYKGRKFTEHWFRKLLRILFNKWMEPNFNKPWCKVGDWIVIPRHEGSQFIYRGMPVQVIGDEYCLGIIKDPTYVTRS